MCTNVRPVKEITTFNQQDTKQLFFKNEVMGEEKMPMIHC